MNIKLVVFLKNFSYTLTSNFVGLLSSTLIVLIAPKIINVEQYGYFQLYILYTTYVALLHFGWNDGIYLRYGGKEYKDLDKALFNSQFWMLVLFEILISTGLIFATYVLVKDVEKIFILIMTLICSLIVIPRGFLLFVLQGTNRIENYAKATMIGKITYVSLFLLATSLGFISYKIIILIDLIGKFISLIYTMFSCRDIVFNKLNNFYFSFKETLNNISVGIKVSTAYLASSLVIGVVKLGIERNWDISTFGKVSLTLSITNLFMIFVNAVGLILFPALRRTNANKLPQLYKIIRDLITVPFLGIILMYYPFFNIISNWLPQYTDSLSYMGILFPVVLYESKMSLLVNIFLKTLRKESVLLKVNIFTLVLSSLTTLITVFVLSSLDLAVFTILFLLMFRYVISELAVSKLLKLNFNKTLIFELLLSILFVISTQSMNKASGIMIYMFVYIVYLLFKKRDLLLIYNELKYLVNF